MKKFQLGPIQQEFIRCLKEDNIPQGQYCLFKRVEGEEICKHCVLGVLIMACIANGYPVKKASWKMRNDRWWLFERELARCSDKLVDFIGLKDQVNLYNRNDGTGPYSGKAQSFSEIAEAIEKNPEKFFSKSV